MTDFKQEAIKKFGTRAVKVNFDEMTLKGGQTLDESLKGQSIYVRQLSGKEVMDTLAAWTEMRAAGGEKAVDAEGKLQVDIGDPSTRNMQAEFVAKTHVTPDNELIWEDATECGESMRFGFIQGAFLAALQINGLGKGAQEEIEGN